MSLSFEVGGSAKSKGSLTSYGPGQMVEAVEGSKEWREEVAWAALQAGRAAGWQMVTRPNGLEVDLAFRFRQIGRDPMPTTQRTYDVDKLARNVLDALQDVRVMKNDAQVLRLVVEKDWADEEHPPGLRVTVRVRVPS